MYKISFFVVVISFFLVIYLNYENRMIGYQNFIKPHAFKNYENIKFDIIDKPIVFDAQRKFLTAIYREKHTGDCDHRRDGLEKCLLIKPEIIIIHQTSFFTLEESFDALKNSVLNENRKNLEKRSYDRLNVSAHFLIDLNGDIYSLMPEEYMARHAIGVNHISLAIENVGLNNPSVEQIESNIKLVLYLIEKYKIKKIYSHAEISNLRLEKNPYFIEKIDGFFYDKYDGQILVEKIREKINLHL